MMMIVIVIVHVVVVLTVNTVYPYVREERVPVRVSDGWIYVREVARSTLLRVKNKIVIGCPGLG